VSTRSTKQIEARWAAVSALAAILVERGLTEAPLAELPQFEVELAGLVEDRILQREGEGVRFFHDRYLDYVFARSFVEQKSSLAELLKSAEQHLERRGQVRQIVAFQREADGDAYEKTVTELLGDQEIRFHIKDVVFSILRDDPTPSERTWAAIREFVEDGERAEHPAAWKVACQPAWFRFLEDKGVVLGWLESNEESDQLRGASMLYAVVDDEPAIVARLLEPFLDAGGEWLEWIRRIVEFAHLEKERSLFDLSLGLLERGLYDEEPESLWHAAHGLPKSEPGWAAELAAAVFAHAYRRGEEQGADPFVAGLFPSGHGMEEFLRELADSAPGLALEVLVPAIITTSRESAIEGRRDGPISSSVWVLRHIGSNHNFAHTAETIAERAARKLAQENPSELEVFGKQLLEAIDFDVPRYLLYRAWEANPGDFADQAVGTLLADDSRLPCGYADSRFWVTRQLLEAATPLCSIEHFEQLEQQIIGYLPESERDEAAAPYRGQAEWTLLSALDLKRLSEMGKARLAEFAERFPFDVESLGPSGVRAGFVGSPIPQRDADVMSDEAWLAAINRYSGGETTWTEDGPVGGAEQVARQLEAAVKGEPDRFARLGTEFPEDANKAYFEAVIRGLADSEPDPEPGLVFDFLRRCHDLSGRPCGRWFGGPLRKLANEQIDRDILEMVGWYAREDPDPEGDSWLAKEGETEYWGGDILTAGINSVRGSAAETISALIFNHPERLKVFAEDLEQLVADPVLAVRACAAQALTTLSRHDAEFATALFLQLVDADEVLLRAPTIERFLGYRAIEDWEQLGQLVERMLGSGLEEVQQVGARRAAICAFGVEEAIELANGALEGPLAKRKGVAQVAAANVGNEDLRETCEGWLRVLFSDGDSEVREEAGSWVQQIDADHLEHLAGLARAFMDSPAYIDDPTMMLICLEETKAEVPDLMLHAARQFAQGTGREAADIRRAAAADASHASNLAMRAYSSSADEELRSQALDVIDSLLASGVRDIQKRISAYDDQ
jgi:hypothetical protein